MKKDAISKLCLNAIFSVTLLTGCGGGTSSNSDYSWDSYDSNNSDKTSTNNDPLPPPDQPPELSAPKTVEFSDDTFTLLDDSDWPICSASVGTDNSPYWPDNDYRIYDAQLGDVDGDGSIELVVIASHTTYYPGQVAIFDSGCDLEARYWNPGWVTSLLLYDITGDPSPEIIVGGTNNDWPGKSVSHIPVVFALDGSNVSGEAPPDYGWISSGTQLWYTALNSDAQEIIRKLSVSGNLIKGNTAKDDAGTDYCVDFSGNITACPTTTGLSDVTVSSNQITIRVWDHGVVDGDQIDLAINGVYVLTDYVLEGSPGTTVSVTLSGGINNLTVYADNEGSISPNTASIEISDVISGDAVQQWNLNLNTADSMTIYAPSP